VWAPGNLPSLLIFTLPHFLLLSFSIFYLFPFLLALSIFLLFHSFPFYQNSPHSKATKPGFSFFVLILRYMYFLVNDACYVLSYLI